MECQHGDNWFDRSICPEPCGSMHTRCNDCGETLGGCPWEDSAEERRLAHEAAIHDAGYEAARRDLGRAIQEEIRKLRGSNSAGWRWGMVHAAMVVREHEAETRNK